MSDESLENILKIIGIWGRYQIFTYFCISCIIVYSVFPMSFIFVARDAKYRCLIESCPEDGQIYEPHWLKFAVPYERGSPNRCLYYRTTLNMTCSEFDQNYSSSCTKFVYQNPQITILQDFNLHCDENLWKLTIVGTVSMLGELLSLPFSAFISDRYGRKSLILMSVSFSTVIGLIRSFSTIYFLYIASEFFDTFLGSGMYTAAFLLALEIVESNKRGIANLIICCTYTLGQVFLSLSFWFTSTWRISLRILYGSGIPLILILFFLPESIRWLLSNGKIVEAKSILNRISRWNQIELDRNLINVLKATNINNLEMPLKEILQSRQLIWRIFQCSLTWICCKFTYYGLTFASVTLSKDIYENFILQAIIEIPAYILTYFSIDHFGRRKTLSLSLFFSGFFCLLLNFHVENNWYMRTIYLIGKLLITVSYTTIYIYTAEMFPTNCRHSSFAICSMCGSVGGILAPQIPLLARIYTSLPMIVVVSTTTITGFLTLQLPETVSSDLPNSINDAISIN